ncbi:sensor histidine kinase [Paenibacillus nasutitermitis]|uniref:Histidine kinase n=1 Tax=Paenibacillus nasutitermitis TaxID=1652958 RepID=A0A916YTR1_9BACL|nr:histidine kinase [Paenibacillus nasutitermitis]GGD59907.1 histidine kinase [Paenibacillus nasutitermitis]
MNGEPNGFRLLRISTWTIYAKLVLSFLLVVIPIVLVSFGMNRSSEEKVRHQIGSSMDSKVNFYLQALESEFARINQLKNEFINDEDVIALSTIPEAYDNFDRQQKIIQISRKLHFFKNSSLYMNRVKVNIPKLGRSIDSESMSDVIPMADIAAVRRSALEGLSLVQSDGKLLMGMTYPQDELSDPSYAFLLLIEISEDELRRSLQSIRGSEGAGAILFADNGSWSLSGGNADETPPTWIEALRSSSPDHQAVRGQQRIREGDLRLMVSYEHSALLSATLAVYESETAVLGPLAEYKEWLLAILVVSTVVIVFFSYGIHRLIHRPLQRLVIAFRKVESGSLDIAIHRQQQDEFQYLFTQFNEMVRKVKSLIINVYEQEIRAQRLELKQLQSQINPHFLYNSYYAIYRLAENEDLEKVAIYTRYLGDYFQYITRTGSDEVTLETEVRHARAYVEIQMLRYTKRIRTFFGEIPPGAEDIPIPKMILQPIIENAYHHGLANRTVDGIVDISMLWRGERLVFTVDDNGNELTDGKLAHLRDLLLIGEPEETTGIVNVNRRLGIRYGRESRLIVSRSDLGGLRVELVLILKGGNPNVQTADRG